MRSNLQAMSWRSIIFLLFLPMTACAHHLKTENVFLITIDGLRWQELYAGADPLLIDDERYVANPAALRERFWHEEPTLRRQALLPFFWSMIARDGQLYGNRAFDNNVNAANQYRSSYPGYSEILTGFADERIDTNDKIDNPNKTVLEFVSEQPSFKGRVAAFGSWDVIPYIINEIRSGIPVNSGFRIATGDDLSEREQFLNDLQGQVPSPWTSVRLDAFTHNYAVEHLVKHRPRLLFIAYGETDDFAHDGEYDAYLESAHRIDAFIGSLWDWVQSNPSYKDKTTFIITTDHGRGESDDWQWHGSDIVGSSATWIAVIGPDTKPLGEITSASQLYLDQVATTLAALLDLDYKNEREVGAVLSSMIE